MTNRIACLIETSGTLRRRIWASLPFHIRLADFLSRIAVTTTEAFGKTIYGEFLSRGVVEGMPEIDGKPASEFDVSKKPVANRLPHNYGKEYGKTVFLKLLHKYKLGPDVTERLMLDYLVGFLDRDSAGLDPDHDRKYAENYVWRKLHWNFQNYFKRKQEISDIYFSGEGKEQRMDLPIFDEDTVERQIGRMLSKIEPRLKAIHPDAPLYVKLSIIEGFSDYEIIGDEARGIKSKLPHPYNTIGHSLTDSSWNMTYKPKIFDVLKESFSDLVDVSV